MVIVLHRELNTFRETCKNQSIYKRKIEICHEFGADNISNCLELNSFTSK